MSVREYIGARYVPVFADPIQWDPTSVYEPLTVVTNLGASYVSRRMVPEGIQLDNSDYWVLWADFNAQLQHYIDEVTTFDGRIDALEDAMPIADYTSASTVSDRIEGVENDFEAFDSTRWIQDKNFVGTNMVVFGDSFTEDNIPNSVNGFWSKRVSTTLGTTLFNYGVAGAGFYHSTFGTIGDQLTTASGAMTATQKTNTSLVIAYAGYNDIKYANNQVNIRNAMITFINNARTVFPNAIILLVPFNWGFNKLTSTMWDTITKTMNELYLYNQKQVKIVPNAWLWNFGIRSRYQNEGHPSQEGYEIISGHMLSAIMDDGNAPTYTMHKTLTYGDSHNPDLDNGFIDVTVINGVVTITGAVRPTVTGSQTITISDLPDICTPCDISVGTPIAGGNGTEQGIFLLNTDGNHSLIIASSFANKRFIFFSVSYLATNNTSY